MDLQEREKNILAGLSFLICFSLFFFIFKPSLEKKAAIEKEVKTLKQELRKPIVNATIVEALNQKVAQLKTEINTLSNQIPETEKRGFLIKDLEDLAKENKIEILSFVPKEAVSVTMTGKEIDKRASKYKRKTQALEERQAKVLKTIISIDANGKFDDIMGFFQDIITYYRAVEVSDLILTRAGASKRSSVDKRFGGGKREDPLQAAKNMDLNINFTLLAYTALPEKQTD